MPIDMQQHTPNGMAPANLNMHELLNVVGIFNREMEKHQHFTPSDLSSLQSQRHRLSRGAC